MRHVVFFHLKQYHPIKSISTVFWFVVPHNYRIVCPAIFCMTHRVSILAEKHTLRVWLNLRGVLGHTTAALLLEEISHYIEALTSRHIQI